MNTIDDMLTVLEEAVESGAAVPFSAGKRMVDVDHIRDIVDAVRNSLPEELQESQRIVNSREQILQNAHREAESIIQQAENRARTIVSEQEIVKRSQQRATEILTAAQNQAKELTRNATVYCENLLKSTEEVLGRSLNEVKSTRMSLRNAANRGMRGGKGGAR